MSQYPSNMYIRQSSRSQVWIYVVSILLVLAGAGVVFYVYRIGYSKRGTESVVSKSSAGKEAKTITSRTSVKSDREKSGLSLAPAAENTAPSASEAVGAEKLIAEAMACINSNQPKIIEARDRLNEVLAMPLNRQRRKFVKEQLSGLYDKWLYVRTVFPEDKLCSSYKVQPGDLLSAIGKRFNVPYELLMKINKISRPEALRSGEVIKIVNGPFHARVSRSGFTMDLFLKNTFVCSFPVGLGKPGMETPTGLWSVKTDGKMIKPIWTDPITGRTYHPDAPDYPLGTRWIALDGIGGTAVGRQGFAIHGTKDPNQIGSPTSQGCIRLHNENAEFVYDLLMPGVSHVEVVE